MNRFSEQEEEHFNMDGAEDAHCDLAHYWGAVIAMCCACSLGNDENRLDFVRLFFNERCLRYSPHYVSSLELRIRWGGTLPLGYVEDSVNLCRNIVLRDIFVSFFYPLTGYARIVQTLKQPPKRRRQSNSRHIEANDCFLAAGPVSPDTLPVNRLNLHQIKMLLWLPKMVQTFVTLSGGGNELHSHLLQPCGRSSSFFDGLLWGSSFLEGSMSVCRIWC